ncbi:MAG: pyridoxine 5'-phosphate synthase [Opitutales bacterium]
MAFPPIRPLLGVNIDHTATVRQARYRDNAVAHGQIVEPDPVQLAMIAERAGADAITLHLREDRRHVQPHDVHRLKAIMQTAMNLEMAATDAMVTFAKEVKPECVLLVPEGRAEVTTEGGLDVAGDLERLRGLVSELRLAGSAVSLFIDPDAHQIEAAVATGADYVELHTGAFANAYYDDAGRDEQFERLRQGALFAHEVGLGVNAGHGINYVNVREARLLPHIREFNIGHAIVSRALFVGLEAAVREMIARLRG